MPKFHALFLAASPTEEGGVDDAPEAGSQKRVWICMDLYGSVRMSKDLQNLGPSKKYKMLISSCVCRNYDSASC